MSRSSDVEEEDLSSHSMRLARPRELPVSMRRGTPVSALLRRFGVVFRCTPDSLPFEERSKLYDLSEPCERFDYFLSHSWRANGTDKYASLTFRFLGRPALFIGALGALLTAGLEAYLDFPFGHIGDIGAVIGSLSIRISLWPFVVGEALVWLTLIKGRHFHASHCFLDCTCIAQADEKLKLQSINMLSGYVAMSDSMIVLWDPTYFERLWCVYELAAITYFSPQAPIHISPIRLATFVLMLHTVLIPLLLSSLAANALIPTNPQYAAYMSVARLMWRVPVFGLISRYGQRLRCSLLELLDHLRVFDARHAGCSIESDRAAILRCIDHHMLSGGLDELNSIVRTKLTELVNAALRGQQAMLGYTHALFVAAPCGFAMLSMMHVFADPVICGVVADSSEEGFPITWMVIMTIVYINVVLFNIPLMFAFAMYLAPERGPRWWGFDLVMHLAVGALCAFVQSVLNELTFGLPTILFSGDDVHRVNACRNAISYFANLPLSTLCGSMSIRRHEVALLWSVGFAAVLGGVTWVVYGPRRRQQLIYTEKRWQ